MAKELKIVITGDATKAENALKRTNNALKQNTQAIKQSNEALSSLRSGWIAAAAALAGVVAIGKSFVDAAIKQEQAEKKLVAVLQATKHAAGLSAAELNKMANEMSTVTGFGDEMLLATQGIMLTFTKIGKETFPQAMNAAADMSVMFGQDMKQSAIQLGTALNDPIRGVGRLRRIGISFTEQQKAQIEQLTKSNDILGAQKVILDELSAEFGGAAVAANKGLGGIVKAVQNTWGDFKENVVFGIGDAMTTIFGSSGSIIKALANFREKMDDIRNIVKRVTLGISVFIDAVVLMGKIAILPILALFSPLIVALGSVAVAIKAVVNAAMALKEGPAAAAKAFAGSLKDDLNMAVNFAKGQIEGFKGSWGKLMVLMRKDPALAAEHMEGMASRMMGAHNAMTNSITENQKKMAKKRKEVIYQIQTEIAQLINEEYAKELENEMTQYAELNAIAEEAATIERERIMAMGLSKDAERARLVEAEIAYQDEITSISDLAEKTRENLRKKYIQNDIKEMDKLIAARNKQLYGLAQNAVKVSDTFVSSISTGFQHFEEGSLAVFTHIAKGFIELIIGMIEGLAKRFALEGAALAATLNPAAAGFFIAAGGLAAGAGLARAILNKTTSNILGAKSAAKGADFITSGPQMLMVGDNPSGQERVTVTPAEKDSSLGGNSFYIENLTVQANNPSDLADSLQQIAGQMGTRAFSRA